MKIYKRRHGQRDPGRMLVTVPAEPGKIKFRAFELCLVPGFPDDIPAAKVWLEEQTTDEPRGVVKEGGLNLAKYEPADEDLNSAIAALSRFCHSISWDSPEEAEDWVADNLVSITDIKAFLGVMAAAMVNDRDHHELVQKYREEVVSLVAPEDETEDAWKRTLSRM